jgi:hypothetical protein
LALKISTYIVKDVTTVSLLSYAKNPKSLLKFTAISIAIIALYASLLGWLTPYLIQKYLPPLVKQEINRQLLIDEIRINPFHLSIEIKQLRVLDIQDEMLAGFDRLYINLQLSSLYKRLWVLDGFIVESPSIHYQLLADGTSNIDDLIDGTAEESEPDIKDDDSAIPEILIYRLSVDSLNLKFSDLSKQEPFNANVGPLNIALDNFTTQKKLDSPYHLKATSAGGVIGSSLEWEGSVSILPLKSSGKIKIDGINLSTLFEYFKEDVPFTINNGEIDLHTEYQLDLSKENVLVNLNQAKIMLSDLHIQQQRSGRNDIELGELTLNNIDYSLRDHSVAIDTVTLSDSLINIIQYQPGDLNLLRLIPSESSVTANSSNNPTNASNATREPSSLPANNSVSGINVEHNNKKQELSLAISNIVLNNNKINWTDNTTKPSAEITLANLSFKLQDFNLKPNSQFPLTLTATMNESGKLSANGQLTLTPLSLDLALTTSTLPLVAIEPYMQQYIRSQIIDGRLDLALDINVNSTDEQQRLMLAGDIKVSDWRSRISANDDDYLNIKSLAIKNISIKQPENTIIIDDISIDQMMVDAILDQNSTLNLSTLIKDAEPKTAPSESSAQAQATILLKRFKLNDSDITFTDYSVSPRYKININPLSTTITGLSSNPSSRASIDLEGKVNQFSPITLNGSINLLSKELYTDFDLVIKNLQMSQFSPYAGTYIGREVDKGKLNLDMTYAIKDQQLDSDNNILIDQFYLGGTVESDEASSLPIGLAITLLKDADDQIHIDLPVQGDLNDPDFSYGKFVWKTLGNLIIKAAASPFTLLAGLVESDEDLGHIIFTAGIAEIDPAMQQRLSQLKKALQKRPELNLEISGCYHSNDVAALKLEQLNALINPDNSKDIVIKQRLKRLESMYKQAFDQAFAYADNSAVEKQALLNWKLQQIEPAMLGTIAVDENTLINLAQQRSKEIQQEILNDGLMSAERILIGQISVIDASEDSINCPMAPVN